MFHVDNGFARYSFDFVAALTYDRPRALSEYLVGCDPATVRDSYGDGLLHVGAQYSDQRLVEHLIKIGCRVNERNCRGDTPLIYAIRSKNNLVAETLLENGADARVRNDFGRGPLHFCDNLDHRHVARKLVEAMRTRYGMGVDELARSILETRHPLHTAVYTGDVELIWLVNERRGDVNELDWLGRSALHAAIYDGNREAIQCLLQLGARLGGALHWAARNLPDRRAPGYRDALEFLLERGARLDELSSRRRTPLHVVAKYGDGAATRLLLEHGADPRARDDAGKGVLHFAAKNRDENVMRLLLLSDNRPDVNARDKHRRTPLHNAAKKLNIPCIKRLLDCNAEVNAMDDFSYTPLYALVVSGDEFMSYKFRLAKAEALGVLLERGADVDIPNPRGDSILPVAALKKLDEILVRHMAKLEQLGRPIAEAHASFVAERDELSGLLARCRLELGAMRAETLFGRVTFFDLLTAEPNTMAGFARNEQLGRALEAIGKRANDFPLYREALERNCELGTRRHDRLTAAGDKLRGSVLFRLPEITELILGLLTDDDLNNVCSR